MSLTLGEKLRHAREERGFTLPEVAEQTRISSLYLESIENDDYRILPGGIFNKGFVKSYAKFVGLNDQEALADYAKLIAANTGSEEGELKVYKPEVLTDDRSVSSMVPTIIFAAVILGIMTAGVLFLVNYIRQPAEPPVANLGSQSNTNAALDTQAAPGGNAETPTGTLDSPDMASLKVEFTAVNQPVPVIATSDGARSSKTVAAGSTEIYTPHESLTLNYNKWNADKVKLAINGKDISVPSVPVNPRDGRIEFTISKENLDRIWTSGAISLEGPSASAPEAPVAGTVETPPAVVATPVKTPSPKPSVVPATNTNSRLPVNSKLQPTPRSTANTTIPANRR